MSTGGFRSEARSIELFRLQTLTGAAVFGHASGRDCELLYIVPPLPSPTLLHEELARVDSRPTRARMIFNNRTRADVMTILHGFCNQGLPLPNVFEPGFARIEGFSPFQLHVYRETCEIPHGETRTYSWLSDRVRRATGARTSAARAVGGAMRSNPFPILIPCHRVVAKSGTLGGYMGENSGGSWQLELKRALLDLEGLYRQPDLFMTGLRDLSQVPALVRQLPH